MPTPKTVLSLIQATGVPTLGNYLGALKNWASMTDSGTDTPNNCIYGVADLHALTVRRPPAEQRRQTFEMYATLLALGLKRENSIVMVQSHVPSHTMLNWLLCCSTQFGEASRMTQFKDKSQQHADNINLGLFTYPTLMAADILIYQAHYVPVGDDQKQHLELARNIAERFNGLYGETFVIPEPYIGKQGGRVMSLQDPTKKMSKSDPNPKACIFMLDPPEVIRKKCRSAVTDSEASVRFAEGKDGINNLMSIYSCCTGESYEQIEHTFVGKGYGDFKNAVAEAIIEELRPFQTEYPKLLADKAYLEQCAREGAGAAARIADRTTAKAMKKCGLWMV